MALRLSTGSASTRYGRRGFRSPQNTWPRSPISGSGAMLASLTA
ncbi:hypothetical protein SFOMI_3873 [Sphingobium fuliginis]|uniref:Uncharacterized protein n=1 Tax=Sphingobium fuliginis (strain ATCC 27551) TaxID=336203 RepID=A0A292ZK79_SPHSA|nr:hypothetical protein SFOMI_3873 [Sphingobium fuliginis]